MGEPLGLVLYGINSIYAVRVDDRVLRCRIKGKILAMPGGGRGGRGHGGPRGRQAGERIYNPLAPGDIVEVQPDRLSRDEGRIVSLHERRTVLERWNRKGKASQVIAANAELSVCVSSTSSPPFRPRFIDRIAAASEDGGLEVLILANKSDLGMGEETRDRLEDFARIGYRVIACSAVSGDGIAEVRAALAGRMAVFIGQSGVGKSSILNALAPGLGLRVGEVSAKFDRGSHTTNCSALVEAEGGIRVIDTPGIRELELTRIEPEDLAFRFREMAPLIGSCAHSACRHDEEDGCAIRAAVEQGIVHPDRYESYCRLLAELLERSAVPLRDGGAAAARSRQQPDDDEMEDGMKDEESAPLG